MDNIARRKTMVDQLRAQGIHDTSVLSAMERVPREDFIPERFQELAYEDRPLPIEEDQTISQPYVVALMLQLAELNSSSHILEVGTGSGYETALLAELTASVCTIEIRENLLDHARERLTNKGYKNISYRIGDGHWGWSDEAPFDAIIVSAAPLGVPKPLVTQLKERGKLVLPVGAVDQNLLVVTKRGDTADMRSICAVNFLPLRRGA